jgi:hypothetical protein
MAIKITAVSLDNNDKNKHKATGIRLFTDLKRSNSHMAKMPKKKNKASLNCGIAYTT